MSEIIWLQQNSLEFPVVENALVEPNGLLAAGGDLSVDRLVTAYRSGIFPWYEEGQPILWWTPNPRGVLFPQKIKITKSLKKVLRSDNFVIKVDQSFRQVITACAEPRDYSDGTWITLAMIEAYCQLFDEGIAHCVEVWVGNKLVGGLYGLAMGQIFFGESMFSRQSNASKVAFAYLAKQLEIWNYTLIDCQLPNQHLASLGAEEISRPEYMNYLKKYLGKSIDKKRWEFDVEMIKNGFDK